MFKVKSTKDAKQKKAESFGETIVKFLRACMDYGCCFYIIMILAVMPFYFTNGNKKIGTDKSVFFRGVTFRIGIVMLILAVCLLTVRMICTFIGRAKQSAVKRISIKGIQINRNLRKKIPGGSALTDLFAIMYLVAVAVSYAMSDYKETAFIGYKGWFMGTMTQVSLVLIYFFLSKCWHSARFLMYLVFPVSVAVFILGDLNRFGVYPIDMKVKSSEFISTVGNINWYCGYIVCVLFLGVVLTWRGGKEKLWKRILLGLYLWIGFTAIVTQGSSSGILTLFCMLVILFFASLRDMERMKCFWKIAFLFGMSCEAVGVCRVLFPENFNYPDMIVDFLTLGYIPIALTIVSLLLYIILFVAEKKSWDILKYFQWAGNVLFAILMLGISSFILLLAANTLKPESIGKLSGYPIFTFDGTWGSNRGATWRAGILCFAEQNPLHKLVGIGPDTMSAYLASGASPALQQMVTEVFHKSVLTNAHNEWLTILVNTGLLGMISYVAMMISGIVVLMKKGQDNIPALACGYAMLAYTINNMFSFQTSMNVATIFVLFGMGMAYASDRMMNPGTAGKELGNTLRWKQAGK